MTTASRSRQLAEHFRYGAENVYARHLGVRPLYENLSDDQARELLELTEAARPEGEPNALNLMTLSSKQRRRVEELVAVGAGLDPGFFENARQTESTAAKFRELARRAMKPDTVAAEREQGFLVELADHYRQGYLSGSMVGLVATVVGEVLARKAGGIGATVDKTGNDTAIVFDTRLGYGPDLPTWKTDVDHLARNAWLVVERRGPEARLGLGSRSRRLLGISS